MGRKTLEDEDQWYGVVDPKQRKKIQDRLAQRARRKRLAASAKYPKSTAILEKVVPYATPPVTSSDSSTSDSPPSDVPGYQQSPPNFSTIPSATSFQVTPSHTVYSALFHNGVLLGLPCSTASISRSLPPASHIPPSLWPSKLQLETVHYQWIDRFPLPRLRDRMIELSDEFSTEDFLADMFSTTESFSLEAGKESWDESAWSIGDRFRSKWGFLFDCMIEKGSLRSLV
ncbi:hypothetical protein BGZ60DRAFT_423649 [Tricladium varicosporioides]|nr:hypothetical protein BGZ60DRAFT_423649 [Hymenoscyphus varicosporioides]